ncbi:hypothetical protein HR45_04325 [Shewanella mangrovi]|uniref:Uncharacterized protein n=1 Tax=Shewanella mangrovi TaxID=1515746 RepID=A0A094JHE4_9GAMM|nr:hypothetical protein [Shewanella mangrovi]KFZ38657.1 hypothetical protein HR45_04325 [Shewanella mangrovi]
MFSHCLSLTRQVDINSPSRILITPKQDVSELLLLEMLNFPLCEAIVSGITSDVRQVKLRVQPIVDITLQPLTLSALAGIERTTGQGFRLYQQLNERKASAINALKQGICIDVVPGQGVFFRVQTAHFYLVALEDDDHLVLEPPEVLTAKTVLARPLDYTAEPQTIAFELSELAQAEQDLKYYVTRVGLAHAPEMLHMVTRLQRQLESKRQWLFRQYCTVLERGNLAMSANNVSTHELQRRLALYEMLVADELKSLVNMMIGEDVGSASG